MKGGSSRVIKGWKQLDCKRLETPGLKKFRNIWVVKVRNTRVVEVRSKWKVRSSWVVKDWKKLGCKSLELGTFSVFQNLLRLL